jgi:predicted oxidoreductase
MNVPQIAFSADGPPTSRIALGMWRLADSKLTRDELRKLVHAAVDAGITTMDHAAVYGRHTCQRIFGEAVGDDASLRKKMQIVTKSGIQILKEGANQRVKYYDTSRAHILGAMEETLRFLKTDHVEVLLVHRSDPILDPDEVASAFVDLKKAGKVLHFGVSNFTNSQFDLLASRLPFPLVTNQVQFSVLHTDPMYDGTFDQCLRLRISPMAWSPLGGGRLIKEGDERSSRLRHALTEVGKDFGGATIEQVALAWIMAHPARIIPILGSMNVERVRSAAAAASLTISRDQWFYILEASAGKPAP